MVKYNDKMIECYSNMNIGKAYRQARNALCFEKPPITVTAQLDNIKDKNRP